MFASNIFALMSALCIATGSMFIGELNGRLPLLQLGRWQLSAAFISTAIISLILGGWHSLGLWQFQLLAASGPFWHRARQHDLLCHHLCRRPAAHSASVFADIAFRTGAWVLRAWRIHYGSTGFGILLVLAGIILALDVPWQTLRGRGGLPRPDSRAFLTGIMLGIITAFGQALGSLFARPVMASGVDPFSAMAVRSGLAALFFLALLVVPAVRTQAAPFQPRLFALAMGSTLFGMVLGMCFLMAALHNDNVGIVSTRSSMTPVLILPLVWLRTGKSPSLRSWTGAILAILGTALISLH